MVEVDKEEVEVEEVTSDNKIWDHQHSSSHMPPSYTNAKINSLLNAPIQPDFLNSIDPSIYKTRQKSVLLMKFLAPSVASTSALNQPKESIHHLSKPIKSSTLTQKIYLVSIDSHKKANQPQEDQDQQVVEEVLVVPEVALAEDKEEVLMVVPEVDLAEDKEVDSVPQEEAEVDSEEEEEDDNPITLNILYFTL